MKSGEGGLGCRREGVVGEVGVCDAGGLRGADVCWGVLESGVLLVSERSILNTHSLSSSGLLAATSNTGPVRREVFGTRAKTCCLLPFPSGRTTTKEKVFMLDYYYKNKILTRYRMI